MNELRIPEEFWYAPSKLISVNNDCFLLELNMYANPNYIIGDQNYMLPVKNYYNTLLFINQFQ